MEEYKSSYILHNDKSVILNHKGLAENQLIYQKAIMFTTVIT